MRARAVTAAVVLAMVVGAHPPGPRLGHGRPRPDRGPVVAAQRHVGPAAGDGRGRPRGRPEDSTRWIPARGRGGSGTPGSGSASPGVVSTPWSSPTLVASDASGRPLRGDLQRRQRPGRPGQSDPAGHGRRRGTEPLRPDGQPGHLGLQQGRRIAARPGSRRTPVECSEAVRTTNQGDPIVLYDPLADRWVVSQFAFGISGGAWWGRSSSASRCPRPGTPPASGTATLPDQRLAAERLPQARGWPDAYYMGINEFDGDTFEQATLVAFEALGHARSESRRMIRRSIGELFFTPLGGHRRRAPAPARLPRLLHRGRGRGSAFPDDRLHVFEMRRGLDHAPPSAT